MFCNSESAIWPARDNFRFPFFIPPKKTGPLLRTHGDKVPPWRTIIPIPKPRGLDPIGVAIQGHESSPRYSWRRRSIDFYFKQHVPQINRVFRAAHHTIVIRRRSKLRSLPSGLVFRIVVSTRNFCGKRASSVPQHSCGHPPACQSVFRR